MCNLIPGIKFKNVFKTHKEYEVFADRFYKTVHPKIKANAIARANSIKKLNNKKY